jgi:hypothetical protein
MAYIVLLNTSPSYYFVKNHTTTDRKEDNLVIKAMQFSGILAATILAFVQAKPVPQQGVDFSTIDYSGDGVDYSTIDYSNDGVDYSTIDYSDNGVDYNTINYNRIAASATTTSGVSTASASATSASTSSGSSPTTSASAGIDNAFTLMSLRSGDINLHFATIYAAHNRLQLGGSPPSSYTPSGIDVPETNITSFAVSSVGLSLRDVVPGGQQVFVDGNGTFGFTSPHSAFIPSGASTTGFSLSASSTAQNSNQYLQFNGENNFLACSNGDATYDLVAAALSKRANCTGISVLASNASNIAPAWEW